MRVSAGTAALGIGSCFALLAAVAYVLPSPSGSTVELSQNHDKKSAALSRHKELKQKLAMTSTAMSKLSMAVERAGAAPTTSERQDMMNNLNLVAGLLASQVRNTV